MVKESNDNVNNHNNNQNNNNDLHTIMTNNETTGRDIMISEMNRLRLQNISSSISAENRGGSGIIVCLLHN